MPLSAKERMQIAMEHEEPDVIPLQVFFVPEVVEILRKKYKREIKSSGIKIPKGHKFLTELDLFFKHDILFLGYGLSTGYYRKTESNTYTDEWGIKWKKVFYKALNGVGHYSDIIGHPLADDSKIDTYKPPNPDDEDMHYAEEIIQKYGNNFYICGDISCSIFEAFKYLRGFAQSLIDLIKNEDIANKIMDIAISYHLKLGFKLIDMGVDMLWLADDIAGEDTLLISPKTFRKMIKPKMDYIIRQFKSRNKNIKIAFHSDGNIEQIIDDLVEVGVDLLNPIQPESMNPGQIKKRYGNKISLWGSISVQRTLPFGSMKDVENEVKERVRSCGTGGGFLIAPEQPIQLDVPLENIDVFYRSVKKYGKYPIMV